MRALLVVLAFAGVGACQSTPLSYPELTDKVANGEQVSVVELRRAFLASPDLPERMNRLTELEQQALQLVDDEPLKLGSIGTAILDTYYGSLTGHFVLGQFYRHVESPEAVEPHAGWLERIRTDMEKSGDGSRTDPYPAMTPVEAKIYAISLGMSPVGSIYQTGEEQPFSMLLQARPEEGAIRSFNFDLTGVYIATRLEFDSDPDFSPFALIGLLAKQGDTAAQAAIGALFASQNRLDDATDWLRAASRTGNLLANSILARIFWERASQAEDPELKEAALGEVLENYLHAVALGSADAMYALGVLYLNDHYGEANRPSGVPLLTQAAELQHSDAAMFLAHLHYRGEVVDVDLERARAYYVQASALENPFARKSYARFLLAEQQDDKRIIDWLEALAREGDAEAMLLLGNLHARGVGVRQSLRRAVSWFKDAVSTSPQDANLVNEVAWTLTVSDIEGLKRARYALSIMETLMTQDAEARRKPEYLDTWAAAYAANGDFGRAITLQEEAIDVAQDAQYESVRDILEDHLEAFRNGQTITEKAP